MSGIEIASSQKIDDLYQYGHLILTDCHVYCIHVKIPKFQEYAEKMILDIKDDSWIDKLSDDNARKTFKATSQSTILKLANDIFSQAVEASKVAKEFGEYLVSHSAQSALEIHSHKRFPLAELLKEKVIGNPGFDFHTESSLQHIIFGEAKFRGKGNPKNDALV